MQTINYTCISCPLGCPLTLTIGDDGQETVSGNSCPRGTRYALEEFHDPKRVITATVAATSTINPRVPVKTALPLPKALVPELLAALKEVKLNLPVTMGDIVIDNFKDSGVNVVVTRTIK